MSNSLDPLAQFDKVNSELSNLRPYILDLRNKVLGNDEPEEWRSTPNLEDIIETNGKGKFRCPYTLDSIKPKRPYKNKNRARVYRYTDINGNIQVISLQKFVAMIYHPNLHNVNMTMVLDGNKDNLHKDNVEWHYIGGRKY